MKQEKCHKTIRRLNNQGFSMVELIISVAVLVIIMVPLMNNFFRSMQMNKKAEKLQLQSNLASSIMEGLKASDITEIINQFTVEGGFNLITETVEDVYRLRFDTDSGELVEYNSPDEQETYYFAINKIRIGGTAYDAFITIDSVETYKDDSDSLNRYPMPEFINLDKKANGLIFSNGTENGTSPTPFLDEVALTSFSSWGEAYAQSRFEQTTVYQSYIDAHRLWQEEYVQAVLDGKTGTDLPMEPTEPTLTSYAATHPEFDEYINVNKIKTYIRKRMLVSVDGKNVTYELQYTCAWPKGPGKLQNTGENNVQDSYSSRIIDKNYPKQVQNVYLFYKPSIFQTLTHPADKVEVTSVEPISFFVAKQGTEINNLEITKSGNVALFTNIENHTSPDTVIRDVVKTQEQDRIFKVKINICKFEDVIFNERYDMVEYSLESTIEQ